MRPGFGQGEERLDAHMIAKGQAPEEWASAISSFTDQQVNPYAETDERRETGLKLLCVAPTTH